MDTEKVSVHAVFLIFNLSLESTVKDAIEWALFYSVVLQKNLTTKNKGVHFGNHTLDVKLKQDAQRIFEKTHTRAEFMKIFGKSYL